jgi:hypothetical protein
MAIRRAVCVGAALALGEVSAATAVPDPCLLTLTEARQLGGSDIVQAGGGALTCDYLAADAAPRLSISVLDAAAPEAQQALSRLADTEGYTEKKRGKMRTWIAADRLEGWVLAGDVLASVSATGESSSKRHRQLELAVFTLSEKLR